MPDRQQIEQAIALQERLRGTVPDAVVDATIAALKGQLAASEPAASPEQQRKQVTILFADVSGFTAMSETMDAEEVNEILNALWQRLDQVILEHGGRIDKHIGDAVMALWGVVQTREDDPAQAIRAALAMQTAMAAFRQAQQLSFGGIRVGINTGAVILSEVGTVGEYTAIGDAVNISARLEQAAPVGGILISHDTYRHVRGLFTVETQPPLVAKGKAEPLQVFRVIGEKARAFLLPTRGVEGVETRMIGRDVELRQLQAALPPAQTTLVTIVGEAGVGKSRLLYEFDGWLRLLPDDVWYLKARAAAAMQGTPYSLLRELLAFRFQIRESDSLALLQQKFVQGVARFLPEAAEVTAHVLGAWLGYDFSHSSHVAPLRQDPQQLHHRGQLYLCQFLTAMAGSSPIVILLEDLHWADAPSLEALSQLLPRCPGIPLLLVGTTRPSLFERYPEWGAGQAQIELHALPDDASHVLVAEILQRVAPIPPLLIDLIVTRAEGNPFYAEELVKMLIDDGVILTDTEPWRVVADRFVSLNVPNTLTGVLQARLDRLDPAARATLQRAAVVGRVFWKTAVAYLAQEDPTEDMSPLQARELVFQRPDSAFDDTPEYVFKHALLHDVAYETVLKRLRRRYHGLAAEWLVETARERGREAEFAPAIAAHFEQAQNDSQAGRWYRRAGELAVAQYAHDEAIAYLSRALRLLPPDDAAVRYDLYLQRESVYRLLGQRQAQAADLNEIEALAFALGDTRRLAEAYLRRALFANETGDYPAAQHTAEQAIQHAATASSADLLARSRHLLASAFENLGEYESARTQWTQAMALVAADSLIAAYCLSGLGTVARSQGAHEEATDYYQRALAICRQHKDLQGEQVLLQSLGIVARILGNYAEAAAYYEQALLVARTRGERPGEGSMQNNIGNIAFDQGQYDLAAARYEQALAIFREVGDRAGVGVALNNMGGVASNQGRYAAARAYFEQALGVRQQIGDRRGEASTLNNLGVVAQHRAEYEAAFALYMRSLTIKREIGHRIGEGETLNNLGHLYLEQGQLAQAETTFAASLTLMNELEIVPYQMEARAGLAAVALAEGNLTSAQRQVETILAMLENQTLDGAEDPFRVYLICYRVLRAGDQPGAAGLLATAYSRLQAQAAQVQDDAMRRAFLTDVQTHRAIVDAFAGAAQ